MPLRSDSRYYIARMDFNANLGIKDYLWDLSIFYGSAIVVARGAEKEKHGLAGSRGLVRHFLQPFGAIVGIRTLECGTGGVAGIGQDLYGLFEHDPESVCGSITAESCIILPEGLLFFILNNLDIHLIIRGTVNRSI